ncbi:MAG: hypothetical protein JSS07_00225 [Proteobacteria bacterium]|nr:hypothetical protein [Pseudomonadota bacterium]
MQYSEADNLNDVYTKSNNATDAPSHFAFYMHHLAQLDKLLSLVSLLKKENKQLRQLLQINKIEIAASEGISQLKPKITCWTSKG